MPGYIKRLDSNVDLQTFPGALFELTGDVPAPQCSEAKIEGADAVTTTFPHKLIDPGKFISWVLTGKKLTITVSPTGTTGTLVITGNTDDELSFDPPGAGDSVGVHYYVHDGGQLILTRNVPSFAAFIHAAGYAYTIKGGKLYTDMPSGLLKDACSILFDPLT